MHSVSPYIRKSSCSGKVSRTAATVAAGTKPGIGKEPQVRKLTLGEAPERDAESKNGRHPGHARNPLRVERLDDPARDGDSLLEHRVAPTRMLVRSWVSP